ncbi:MAG: hypothetical protein O3C43_10685 [Verrucomicrobia bacterium]|nr:hypothetical protein [Verrucomicrobiota bacterium]MDA1066959.1 hypothetical protein [Verrucomicrobiota bacterium]
MRVGIAYCVVGWGIMEVGDLLFPNLGIPQWVLTALILVVIAGFPIALVLAWVYELTPQGIRNTDEIREEQGESTKIKPYRPSQHALLLFITAAVPTLIFGAAALYFFLRAKSVSDQLTFVTQTEFEELTQKSFAVMPMENLSPDPNNDHLALAVHEEISNTLAEVNDLRLIARPSILSLRGTTMSLEEIGNELGARYILEGSVQRLGNQLKVFSKLIDVQTNTYIWSGNFDGVLEDIFDIQSNVAQEVAKQLQINPNVS